MCRPRCNVDLYSGLNIAVLRRICMKNAWKDWYTVVIHPTVRNSVGWKTRYTSLPHPCMQPAGRRRVELVWSSMPVCWEHTQGQTHNFKLCCTTMTTSSYTMAEISEMALATCWAMVLSTQDSMVCQNCSGVPVSIRLACITALCSIPEMHWRVNYSSFCKQIHFCFPAVLPH